MAGSLSKRLERLEERGQAVREPCPEHLSSPFAPKWVDYRDGLAAFSPDPAERARYDAEQDRLEAQPPCPRCGWRPTVIRVRTVETWGQHFVPVDEMP
jgi:hypothetical protein